LEKSIATSAWVFVFNNSNSQTSDSFLFCDHGLPTFYWICCDQALAETPWKSEVKAQDEESGVPFDQSRSIGKLDTKGVEGRHVLRAWFRLIISGQVKICSMELVDSADVVLSH
jgi:hypothetical protein